MAVWAHRRTPNVLAFAGQFPVLLTETIDSTAAIDDLLLAGIKRVASGAHFHLKILTQGRTSRKLGAA